jgi:hypothetical protein
MVETEEKKKPGPAPVYGPRKMVAARVDVEEWKEFKANCDEAGISVSEALAFLVRKANLKKRKEREASGRPAPKYDGPPIKDVSIVVLENHGDESPPVAAPVSDVAPPVVSIARGSPPAKDSPWPEISRRLKPLMGLDTWEIWISSLTSAAFENCRLLLHCPNPFFVQELRERHFDDAIAEVAAELCGEPIKVLLEVSPEFEERQRKEEEERATKERETRERIEREAKERPEKIEKLKALYLSGTPEDARSAEKILFADESILGAMQSFVRKQIEGWIDSAKSGTTYQAAKEREFNKPRNRGHR